MFMLMAPSGTGIQQEDCSPCLRPARRSGNRSSRTVRVPQLLRHLRDIFVIMAEMVKKEQKSEGVLYRKYRPQAFDEVIGQDHVVKVLKGAVELGNIAHAYLF